MYHREGRVKLPEKRMSVIVLLPMRVDDLPTYLTLARERGGGV